MNSSSSAFLATFWHGPPLSAMDKACLLSFVKHGFRVKVYSYQTLSLPDGIDAGDARSVMDEQMLGKFIADGRPSLAHFSDVFRYKLINETGETWIDTDLVCIRPFAIPDDRNFFGMETEKSVNNAILRLVGPQLPQLIDKAMTFANGENYPWGATGPALITQFYGAAAFNDALPREAFYPIHWDDWWMPFLPSQRARCEQLCKTSFGLHLWNNIVEKAGYWKELAPPEGSFLNDLFRQSGSIDLFTSVMPERTMEAIALNSRNLRDGSHFKFSELLNLFARRAVKLLRQKIVRS
ncbi:MAG: hypothetical protein ACOH2J_02980 [Allorhizobium sp.]